MNVQERSKLLSLKHEREILRRRLDCAVDKEILLLNQVIDLQHENRRLKELVQELIDEAMHSEGSVR